MSEPFSSLPVAVIGAGPVGLAAAAHLLARGLTPLVFEAGSAPATNLRTYAHVQLFSPWRDNVDKAASARLEQRGWKHPAPEVLPTAGEIVNSYLVPLAQHPEIEPHIHFNHRVVGITRSTVDKIRTATREATSFSIRVDTPNGEREYQARLFSMPAARGTSRIP
jgi:cation diffusion facilitator CzcD-associated flavoprotein CzcO